MLTGTRAYSPSVSIKKGVVMRGQTKSIRLSANLTDAQAWNLAQFLRRVGFSEFRSNAQDEQEAYAMRDAAEIVRKALAEQGYAPR